MKTIDEAFEYDHQPTDVFDLIADAAFQLELIMHLGGKDAELVEPTTTSEGNLRLVNACQKTGVELPGFAKRLIPATHDCHVVLRVGARRRRQLAPWDMVH